MASTTRFSMLGQATPAAGVVTRLYQSPQDTSTIVSLLQANAGTNDNVSIQVVRSGHQVGTTATAKFQFLVGGYPLTPSSTDPGVFGFGLFGTEKVILGPGDSIYASSAVGAATFNVAGAQIQTATDGAVTYGVLGQLAPGNTDTLIYQCPSGAQTSLLGTVVGNITGGNDRVWIKFVRAGNSVTAAGQFLATNVQLNRPAYVLTGGDRIHMQAGDALYGRSQFSLSSFNCFGLVNRPDRRAR